MNERIEALTRHALGADLVWWRTSGGAQTSTAVHWPRHPAFSDATYLQAVLFDMEGEPVLDWQVALTPDRAVLVDSAADGPWRSAHGTDGVLALYVCTREEPSARARETYNRLFPMVRWRMAESGTATLHSDQVVCRERVCTQRFTEIVVDEDAQTRNALIILNGEKPQRAGALAVKVTNHAGDSRTADYPRRMPPMTVQRVALADLFSDLESFGAGKPLMVGATFESEGLYTRPYVETRGARFGMYHAGDVYSWDARPYAAHAFIGGEVNPMAVVHDERTRTVVNLLNSHDGYESDMPVTVQLFDAEGCCVAERVGWKVARRHGLDRFDISELLPDPSKPFRGHVALTFAPQTGEPVPRRLQALMEYTSPGGIAHVMGWSDEWNSDVRRTLRQRLTPARPIRACYPAWGNRPEATVLAMTNAGHHGYAEEAEVRVRLVDESGELGLASRCLAPFETWFADITDLFPDLDASNSSGAMRLVIVESESDIASIAFVPDARSGSLAAEHLMAITDWFEEDALVAAGS